MKWEPSCSTRTDGQTDITKLTVAFRNLANAPENCRQSRNYQAVAIIQTSHANQRLISPSTLVPLAPKILFSFWLSNWILKKTVAKSGVGWGGGGSNCVPIRICWWVILGKLEIIPHVTVAIAINLFNFSLISNFFRFNRGKCISP